MEVLGYRWWWQWSHSNGVREQMPAGVCTSTPKRRCHQSMLGPHVAGQSSNAPKIRSAMRDGDWWINTPACSPLGEILSYIPHFSDGGVPAFPFPGSFLLLSHCTSPCWYFLGSLPNILSAPKSLSQARFDGNPKSK